MFNYGNIQLKVCGITDQKSLEVIQKYSVRTVGLVSNYLYGPNTLSTEEIHNLTIASYNLKLNPKANMVKEFDKFIEIDIFEFVELFSNSISSILY